MPSASSTPAVVPAMTSRRACKARRQMARERVGVDVQQPAIATETDARDHRHETAAEERVQHAHVGVFPRNADRTERHHAAVHGAMRRRDVRQSTRRVRSGQPDGATPAVVSAATNRVLITPARTDTTTSNVGSSVIRSPSICRFSMPAAFSAASISLPPPWTIARGVERQSRQWPSRGRAAVPDPRAVRRQI